MEEKRYSIEIYDMGYWETEPNENIITYGDPQLIATVQNITMSEVYGYEELYPYPGFNIKINEIKQNITKEK